MKARIADQQIDDSARGRSRQTGYAGDVTQRQTEATVVRNGDWKNANGSTMGGSPMGCSARGRLRVMSLMFLVAFGLLSAPGIVRPAEATGSAGQLQPASSTEAASAMHEEALVERVSARWDAMIRKDFQQAYEFLTPSYRQLFPFEHMRRLTGGSIKWLSIDIESISIEGEKADVVLTLHYKLSLPPAAGFGSGEELGVLTKRIEEVWLLREGQWWYVKPDGGRL